MAIPQVVREVKRPKNTVVTGPVNGPYAVRERVGCRYKVDENGKRHRIPVEGAVIGHIVNLQYIPNTEIILLQKDRQRVDVKEWANVYICDRENSDILVLLRQYYHEDDAEWIYCEAILRACYSGIRDYELQNFYEGSFLSIMYPRIGFSKDTVSEKTFLLGRQRNTFYSLMKSQIAKLSEHDVLIIDGSLKDDNSDDIYLAEVSRKTKKTGTKQHTMMYAYSFENKEPVAQKDYPGNMTDARAILDFVNLFDIKKGMLMADKGFTINAIMEAVEGRNDLKYLIPLHRNQQIIDQYNLLKMDDVIIYENQPMSCHKVQLMNKENNLIPTWLYAYVNPEIAKTEEENYLLEHRDSLDNAEYENAKKEFGLIVFQSNYDSDLKSIYDLYTDRWDIEVLFKFHKTVQDEDDTRMGSDHSAVASDFIDFLSTVMGIRMVKFFNRYKNLRSKTFKAAMEELRRCRKVRVDDGEWVPERMTAKRTKLMVEIGIIEDSEKYNHLSDINTDPFNKRVKSPRGRPKGKKDSKPRKRRSKDELNS